MNPAFDPRRPRTQGSTPPSRPASSEQPPDSAAQQSAGQSEARREPSFDELNSGDGSGRPFAGPTYARFEQQPSWHQQTGPSHKNPVSRAMFMAGIFVVGAAVGLAATWWMNKSVDKPPTAPAVRKFEPAPPTPAPGGSGSASAPGTSGTSGTGGGPGTPMAGPTDGINPGELPYDGNPPGAGASVNAAPATALPPVQRVPDTEPKEPPRQAEGSRKTETARSAAKTDAQSEKPSAPVVTAAPPPAPSKKAEQSVAEAPEGPPAKTPPPAKPRETKVAKAPPRQQRTTAAIPKDKEIDRIRQQVDEELKKKD